MPDPARADPLEASMDDELPEPTSSSRPLWSRGASSADAAPDASDTPGADAAQADDLDALESAEAESAAPTEPAAEEAAPSAATGAEAEASDSAGPAAQAQGDVAIPRHPLVGTFTIGLPLLAIATFGLEPQALIAAIASVALTLLAAIDLEHRILPNRIIGPATAVLLALQLIFFPGGWLAWLLAGPAAATFLALPLIIRRDAMGMGDIKLAVLLGVILGWDVFGAIIVGCLAMVPVALWMLVRDGSIRNATLPFGPFLAFGTLVLLFTS